MVCRNRATGSVESFTEFLELVEASDRSSLDICNVDFDWMPSETRASF